MATASLTELRAANDLFNKRWKANGGKLTSYTCKHCNKAVRVRQPGPNDVQDKGYWDSLTKCVHCGGLNFVFTYPDGRTVVNV